MTAQVFSLIDERVKRGIRPRITLAIAAHRYPGTVHKFMVENQPVRRETVDAFLMQLDAEKSYIQEWFN